MLQWLSVDATGKVVAYLPSLSADGPLRRTMGRYESQTATLVVDLSTDAAWIEATSPFESALIAYETSGAPVWGGIVTHRSRDMSNVVKLTLATPEVYLDRRFATDYSVTGRDQNLIVTDLLGMAGGVAGVAGSFGWSFTSAVAGSPGVARDRAYLATDDKTIYSALQELAGVIGGPQWLTGWAWTHNPERVIPVLRVGTRIGVAMLPGFRAPATFTEQMLTAFTFDEDYSSGKGANWLTAVSSGQGGTRPQATAYEIQPHRPVVEHRWTPSTSISNTGTLQNHADAALAQMRVGTRVVSFTAARSAAPQVGVDWDLGDDIGYSVNGPTLQAGITGVGQVIGYDVGPDTLTPYIAQGG